MGTITKFKVEEDAFYIDGKEEGRQEGRQEGLQKGIEIGEEKSRTTIVKNMLTKHNFSDEQTAELAQTSVSFVQNIRSTLC